MKKVKQAHAKEDSKANLATFYLFQYLKSYMLTAFAKDGFLSDDQ